MHNNSFLFNCQPFLVRFSARVFHSVPGQTGLWSPVLPAPRNIRTKYRFIILFIIMICPYIRKFRYRVRGRTPSGSSNSPESFFPLDRRGFVLHFRFFERFMWIKRVSPGHPESADFRQFGPANGLRFARGRSRKGGHMPAWSSDEEREMQASTGKGEGELLPWRRPRGTSMPWCKGRQPRYRPRQYPAPRLGEGAIRGPARTG